jgi:hypothetical protein
MAVAPVMVLVDLGRRCSLVLVDRGRRCSLVLEDRGRCSVGACGMDNAAFNTEKYVAVLNSSIISTALQR